MEYRSFMSWVVKRDQRWLKDPGQDVHDAINAMIVVEGNHPEGPDGIVNLLRRRGYLV